MGRTFNNALIASATLMSRLNELGLDIRWHKLPSTDGLWILTPTTDEDCPAYLVDSAYTSLSDVWEAVRNR
jgi:hypothetical protein